MRVLIIEDNIEFSQLIASSLARSGFEADCVSTAATAERAVESVEYGAIILDLGLPDEDGLEFLRRLRQDKMSTPVLIASARNGLEDRVRGLREGADDYIAKPFSTDELVARVGALMRRPRTFLGTVLSAGNVSVDTRHQVSVGERAVAMRPREAFILHLLVRQKNKVVTRRFLDDQLFGIDSFADSNTIEVYVHRLRKNLQDAEATVTIHNIRGVGYMLREDDAPSAQH